ncbi:GTP-binding protein [Acidithiobacillus thiooxidans]|uniref:phospholipase D-like domain-containing protein n=1 Tax=Acidithiobacillus TaxID=119977 RepID=UPI001879C10E|nr:MULTISPECIES: phospholipase D-like domain-containing protein [Acidithiobacillus]MBE7567746.1 GTP-binding protein [Acidithiobacillus sp. HP-11]MBU2752934.1 GTP-binding protein [Acidithiobacillus thiooxidans]MBU2793703.1 GTP-binding protein [Acidithiobacillus thiooxidans]
MPLYIEPHAGPAPIVQLIRSAHHAVSVGVYYLSDRPILQALKTAHARGVNVRVIIEGKPYGMKPWQVRKEEREIESTGATLHLAPYRFTSHGDHYAFLHAKYVCSGNECEIGTANFDWSAFHRNREYLYVTKDPAVVKAANAVFHADWNNRRAPAYAHRVLVLAPRTSAAQIIGVIQQPGPIDIESEEMGPYRPTLDAIARKGPLARVILPASINAQDKQNVAFLRAHGVQVRMMPVKPIYMHAKAVISGNEALIGSENFTKNSLEDNREMGLLLHGRPVSELQAQFNRDWVRAGRGSM